MTLTIVNLDGTVIAKTDQGTMITPEQDAKSPPPSVPTSQPGEEDGRDLRARPIVLGPKTRPPLPTSVQLVRVVGRLQREGGRPFTLHLDRDIEANGFTSDISRRLTAAMASGPETLELDVYVPLLRSIDVTELSRHIAELSDQSPRLLRLRVGSQLEED